ncbi:mitochondrial assembly of ribosomal large subunit protein 1 [Molossus molossus]|uniref:Mitochondrial assembly of ribosomal large subunit protein 1 n=1 Tax=Molossus molossus TaxID=27622 RepID=A0A7J8HC24_MOLMO|nr:mitochondrial assembly of ribosomal large subunit protein 1 [Molossus molossus]XP_036102717.1 mitochondrial assembly of ribosomal large subunit protein 1 [Molossus molossus]XP_036102718.1 mitochondrial assembly of ribosomal large subunit protein 1 [Molossus molossus]XP_036102719.1 mitochondrial assembly of ribosomal large subunit protein 1 [Molossus molossus]XP_036102720.1 mitochondrial assembly of ribosomal large subunit protein 1 [Molossus molossus]XP_036102721.1 mitochondrial assembly of
MGPGGCVARRLWTLLGFRALSPAAGSAAGAGCRLRLLAAERLPAGPALSRACLTADRARGLHGGPGLEERTEGAASEGRRESGAADHAGPKFDIDMLVSLLRQENARDICVIKIPPEMKYTDYFVIGSGTSTRHLHAMAYYIVKMYKFLKSKSEPYVKIEGKDTDDWLCVDFGSMVIHLMLPETRETYELEKLWTLRSYDDQLAQIAPETLPEDFILGIEDDTSSLTPVEFKCE